MELDYIKEILKIREFLEEILLDKESNDVEFKSVKSGFLESFRESYSSFANTNSGVIIFGVEGNNYKFKYGRHSKYAFLEL